MTDRPRVLDMIGRLLVEELGRERVTQRPDGVIILAGTSEAFAIQAFKIDVPEGVEAQHFGEELVKFIEGKTSRH